MRQIMRTLHLPVGSENKFLQFGAFVSQIYDAIRICPNVGAENRNRDGRIQSTNVKRNEHQLLMALITAANQF